MENEQIKQYLISFVERTLNKCEAFTRIYGKDFVRQRLEVNLDKVYTNIYHKVDNGQYSLKDRSIRIFSGDENAKPLTIKDIKSNFNLQHDILHEAIHAIFRRTDEECEKLGIEAGTGVYESYNDSLPLGDGFNEGLTEWICKKAGYPLNVYGAESDIIELFELAIGEDKVMQLAKGDIRGNVAELLQMSEEDTVKTLNRVDDIWQREGDIDQIYRIISALSKREGGILTSENQDELKEELGPDYESYSRMMKNMGYLIKNVNGNDVNEQLSYLRRMLSSRKKELDFGIGYFTKEDVYLRYFSKEIEDLQNANTISKEAMDRLTALYNNISEEQAVHSKPLLKFKNELYPELQSKAAVVNESKFAEIYGKAKGSINQVFGNIKAFFIERTDKKNNDKRIR